MSAETMHWYRSKVDWWLAPLLAIPPVAAAAVCASLVLEGKESEWPWGVGAVLLVLGIYSGLVFPMKYGLDENCLLVRFGLCRQRIALGDIVEVHPTRNPLSSPALSLDRLHVQYGQGFFKAVMISPSDRRQFLDELAHHAGLSRDGDRLVRSTKAAT